MTDTREHNETQAPLSRERVNREIDRLWAEHLRWQSEQARRYPEQAILEAVAAAHGMTVPEMRSVRRTRRYAWARHHAVWELRRRRQDLGLQQIAAQVDRLDHTTAVHSYGTFCAAVLDGRYAAERAAVEAALEDRT